MRILDSTVLIDILRGDTAVRSRLLSHAPRELAVPSVVRAELMVGAGLSRDGQAERFKLERLLLPIPVLDFDERDASAYGVLRVMMQKDGRTMGIVDTMIAAATMARDAILVTSDARGFIPVPGLITEDWRAA